MVFATTHLLQFTSELLVARATLTGHHGRVDVNLASVYAPAVMALPLVRCHPPEPPANAKIIENRLYDVAGRAFSMLTALRYDTVTLFAIVVRAYRLGLMGNPDVQAWAVLTLMRASDRL